MKYIFPPMLMIFLLMAAAFAQSSEERFCPKISVEGPSHPPRRGETITFRANVTGLTFEPKYEWTISSGTMISGRGTNQIDVLVEKEGWGVTATVEIPGVSRDCVSQASDTAPPLDRGDPVLVDDYGLLPWKNETEHLDSIKRFLKKDLDAQAYFLIYGPNNLRDNRKRKNRISLIEKYFGEGKDRLTFVQFVSEVRKTKVYLVPAGNDPPRP